MYISEARHDILRFNDHFERSAFLAYSKYPECTGVSVMVMLILVLLSLLYGNEDCKAVPLGTNRRLVASFIVGEFGVQYQLVASKRSRLVFLLTSNQCSAEGVLWKTRACLCDCLSSSARKAEAKMICFICLSGCKFLVERVVATVMCITNGCQDGIISGLAKPNELLLSINTESFSLDDFLLRSRLGFLGIKCKSALLWSLKRSLPVPSPACRSCPCGGCLALPAFVTAGWPTRVAISLVEVVGGDRIKMRGLRFYSVGKGLGSREELLKKD